MNLRTYKKPWNNSKLMKFEKLKRTGIDLEIWKNIVSIFIKHPNVENVILFGSRALGNYKLASDLDLCIVGKNIDFIELASIEDEMDTLFLPWKIDLVLWSGIDNQKLREHIQKHGISVLKYE